jgi:3',5'-cyclic AMP phosphodiesterase CpdA
MADTSRRQLLLAAGAAATGLLVQPAMALAPKRRALRVAHMTDFHIQPELAATEGSAKALRHAMGQKPKVDLILAGGDLIMDAYAQTEARTKTQWDLFTKVTKAETNVPIKPCMGNHDVWGWNKKDSNTTGSERQWGKRWFTDLFELPKPYYSFDQAGWHFVVLDNILLTPDGYNGLVEPEQMEWLKQDLQSTNKPTVVTSHIPILSITSLAGAYDKTKGDWTVGGNLLTKNSDDLRALFGQHKHVKIALSGHIHMVDRVDFSGVSYMCGGAVCGAWWNGANGGFNPGYRVLDLFDDGSFETQYIEWGWKKS